jgi:nitrogen fixation protein NifB
LGAFISNIIPLIPVEGTKFADKPKLDIAKLQQIRDLCPPDMKQMKHCRQCRADAVGLLGEDRSQELFTPYHKNECKKTNPKVRIAVTSSNGRAVDLHFGHAGVFHIYETDGEIFDLVDVRNIEQYCKEPVECGDDEQRLASVIEALKDCKYILVSRIGLHPARKLAEKGIEALMVVGTVAELVPKAARGEVSAIKWDQETSGIA